jgi:hypothetical protein
MSEMNKTFFIKKAMYLVEIGKRITVREVKPEYCLEKCSKSR